MRPERLPRSEADLAGWKVYSDWLLSKGDPLGELLGLELTLPALANALELQRFHHVAKRHCHASKLLEVGWCLGHARTVAVLPEAAGLPMTKRLLPRAVTAEQLGELKAFLQRPVAQLVESIEVSVTADLMHELKAALQHAPQTCRELVLGLQGQWFHANVSFVTGALPPGLDRVKPTGGDLAPLLEQFATVDLRAYRYPFLHLPPGKVPRLIAGSIPLLRQGRARLEPGDAALLDVAAQSLELLSPLPLARLQKRHGVIAVQAQLNRTVPELHVGPPRLLRSPSGRWELRVDHESLKASVDGQLIAVGQIAPLVTGSRVLCEGRERVFLEDAALWPAFCP